MRKIIAIIVLCALPAAVLHSRERAGRKEYDLKRHEVSVSGAWYPGRYLFGDFNYYFCDAGPGYSSISSIYENSRVFEKEKSTNSWFLDYTYNFNKVLAIQAGISYEGIICGRYGRSDKKRISKSTTDYISPMVGLRVSWLNRGLVRLYSGVEAGVAVKINRYDTLDASSGYVPEDYSIAFSGQLTALGLSVGKKLFGFAEVGLGTRYAGGCLGIGYRF